MERSAKYELDKQVMAVEYATAYRNVCAVGTFDWDHWFHGGAVHVLHVASAADRVVKPVASIDVKSGVRALAWSEQYGHMVAAGCHSGSVAFVDANEARVVSTLAAHREPVSDVAWNALDAPLVCTAGQRGDARVWSVAALARGPVATLREHTRAVRGVAWNPLKGDELATVADDGLAKVWDCRAPKQSVSTLADTTDPRALTALAWHKADDWVLCVGNKGGKVAVWDTRNALMPVKVRPVHRGAVTCVALDTTHPDRLATCSDDQVTRVWDLSHGILLTAEHREHTAAVHGMDWDVHRADVVTTVSADATLRCTPIDAMTAVEEEERRGTIVTRKTPPTASVGAARM